jgi:hypothetical protein
MISALGFSDYELRLTAILQRVTWLGVAIVPRRLPCLAWHSYGVCSRGRSALHYEAQPDDGTAGGAEARQVKDKAF